MLAIPSPQITEERIPPALTIALISSSGVRAAEAVGLTEHDLVLDSETPYYVIVRGTGDRMRGGVLPRSRTCAPYLLAGAPEAVCRLSPRVLARPDWCPALRHTATHHMLDRGMSEHNVATQLGHKSLKMLGRYGRARATGRSRDDFFRTSER